MNRLIAIAFALCLTLISLSSTAFAEGAGLTSFTLRADRGPGDRVQADFRDDRGPRSDNHWSASVRPSELIGFDMAGFRSPGGRTQRFALVREAGRLDCVGSGRAGVATGNCRFTRNEGFAQLLSSRGVGNPTRDQAFTLMALDVRRALVDSLAAARFPTPTIDQLVALTALGVNRGYISELSRAGYRPQSINALIDFKALGITPQWIAGLARVGYGDAPSKDLVAMKALGVTADYIAGFQRIGYRHLSPNRLVELKAVGVTPADVAAMTGSNGVLPPESQLVERKMWGHRR